MALSEDVDDLRLAAEISFTQAVVQREAGLHRRGDEQRADRSDQYVAKGAALPAGTGPSVAGLDGRSRRHDAWLNGHRGVGRPRPLSRSARLGLAGRQAARRALRDQRRSASSPMSRPMNGPGAAPTAPGCGSACSTAGSTPAIRGSAGLDRALEVATEPTATSGSRRPSRPTRPAMAPRARASSGRSRRPRR